jgi:hypothetical protein
MATLLVWRRVSAGRIVFVLEDFGGAGVQGQEKLHPVTKLDVPEQEGEDSMYKLQVSGKRNHTYYVNVALKVLARRQWSTSLELSGLGNGMPSFHFFIICSRG